MLGKNFYSKLTKMEKQSDTVIRTRHKYNPIYQCYFVGVMFIGVMCIISQQCAVLVDAPGMIVCALLSVP